jgi:ech hydrogenase subunit F
MSCIQCRSCVDNCPKKCLSMDTHYTEPGSEKITKTFKQSEKAIAAQEALMKAAKERAAAAAAAKAAAAGNAAPTAGAAPAAKPANAAPTGAQQVAAAAAKAAESEKKDE